MEAVITLVVVGLAVLVVVQTGSLGRAIQTVVGQTAALLPMAAALTLSLRAAAPNLAVALVVFAVLSVGGGVLFAVAPALQMWFGSARPDHDPARRPTIQRLLAVFLALTVSSGVAAAGGMIGTSWLGAATLFAAVDIGIVLVAVILVAVILGGASLYDRRTGILGTLLGALAITLFQLGLTLSDASLPVVLGVVALLGILGLVATRLVETFGRADRPASTGIGGPGSAG